MSRDYGSRAGGNYAKWNIALAQELWDAGLRADLIAEAVSTPDLVVTEKAIMGQAMRKAWTRRVHREPLVKKGPSPKVRRCPDCFAKHEATEAHDCKGRATTLRFANGWAA